MGSKPTGTAPEKPWDASSAARIDDDRAPTPMDAWVGARIRARRIQVGWSIVKLSQAVSVSRQQVEKWEAGRTRMTAGRLYDVALAMDVHPGFFFDGFTGGQVPQGRPPDIAELATPEGVQLLNAYQQLSPDQKRALRLVAQAFVDQRAREDTYGGHHKAG